MFIVTQLNQRFDKDHKVSNSKNQNANVSDYELYLQSINNMFRKNNYKFANNLPLVMKLNITAYFLSLKILFRGP